MFVPAQGCIELLKRYNIPIAGKNAVVLGRSNIVGVPASQLLLQVRARSCPHRDDSCVHPRRRDQGSCDSRRTTITTHRPAYSLQENATVTVCHSRTPDVAAVIRGADIVVAAIGKANFVQGEWLKPGAVVIDVGINSVPDASRKAGYRLVGDVDYESCIAPGRASAITPVPGGVGPMTIAMLLTNTVNSYERAA